MGAAEGEQVTEQKRYGVYHNVDSGRTHYMKEGDAICPDAMIPKCGGALPKSKTKRGPGPGTWCGECSKLMLEAKKQGWNDLEIQ